ncbi:MAG: sugar-binding domain-containing protein, partial [Peptostreptococcaceae bacterium]
MQEILALQKKIVPELVEVLEKRYNILRTIYYNQPIGRRVLASELNLGERIVRTEISFLKSQGLIEVNTPGMSVTEDGKVIVKRLKEFIHELKGLDEIEEYLKAFLGLKDVIIVPGDIDSNPTVLKDLGKAAAVYVKNIIRNENIIAITGGSTMKEVVEAFPKITNTSNVLVVPARGGMGRKVESQANTLAASLAKKINASYKLLHIPENVSAEVLDGLLKESQVKDVIESIQNADILIYGIGNAIHMAKKRETSDEFIEKLEKMGAIGEAYGCYFNKDCQMISENNSIGINFRNAKKIKTHIAVAAGKNKIDAIIASEMYNPNAVLVTDESS